MFMFDKENMAVYDAPLRPPQAQTQQKGVVPSTMDLYCDEVMMGEDNDDNNNKVVNKEVAAAETDTKTAMENSNSTATTEAAATAAEVEQPAEDPQLVVQQQLHKLLYVPSHADRNLLANDRVIRNMVRCERLYLPTVPDYFRTVQSDVKPHMRKIVADWLLEVCQELGCQPEVFCLAVSLMDRFLARCAVSKGQLQLLGCVCLFLASKFRDTAPVPSEKLVMFTDFSVSVEDIREWELLVLHKLKWDLGSATPLDYLDHVIPRIAGGMMLSTHLTPDEMGLFRRKAETIATMSATHYLFSYTRPSVMASAAVGVALRSVLGRRLSEPIVQAYLAGIFSAVRIDNADLEECTSAMLVVLPEYLTKKMEEEEEASSPADAARLAGADDSVAGAASATMITVNVEMTDAPEPQNPAANNTGLPSSSSQQRDVAAS